MSRSAKLGLLSLIVVGNLAVLWWRYEREGGTIPGVGPHVAALGEAQVDLVSEWRSAKPVPLTPAAIDRFVHEMSWDGCSPLPSAATPVAGSELSAAAKQNLLQFMAGLIEAYAESDPEKLYDLMAKNGESLSPTSVATLRQLLVTDGKMPAASVRKQSPRELFLLIAQRTRYDSCWDSLAKDTGCITLWKTPLGRDQVLEKIPLGGSLVGLFKNQTRYHHLFESKESRSLPHPIYADVRFTVQHDHELMSEPSAYYVRLALERSSERWRPLEMVHVATISGNSPVLLF